MGQFVKKWTPEQIETVRTCLSLAKERGFPAERGYQNAANLLKTTPAAIRRLLLRIDGPKSYKRSGKIIGRIHVVIGDTQVKPGVPTQHLTWIGQYCAERFARQDVAFIHLGDHWDMPSLSSYDFGKKAIEGRRYIEDVKAGNEAFARLNEPIAKAMDKYRWKPERHFLLGNHENRITRACNDTATLEGKLSLDDLDLCGWQRHTFLEVVTIDGIAYSHYFYNPNTSRPYAGENLLPRLKTIGRSFSMGHQQGLMYTLRPVGTRRHHGLVLGSSYLHDEDYLGPQGNAYWRGIVVCHQVEDGQYDPMFVSLDYLCRRFEGVPLAEFMQRAA